MDPLITAVITIFCSVAASSGFWAWITRKSDKNDFRTQLILGLAHDRIIYLALHYIEREWITKEEYDNLHKYLYTPYLKLGGNGTATRLMKEIESLDIKSNDYKGVKT